MIKLLTDKKFIVNAGLIVLGIAKFALQSQSDAMARIDLKNELKNEILKELGKNVVEVVIEDDTTK